MVKYNFITLIILIFAHYFLLSAHCRPFKTAPPPHGHGHDRKIFDVVDYGAVGDGHHDDSKAFNNAWNALCKSSSSNATMHIPHGKSFLLQPLTFSGKHCESNKISLKIDGTIIAPSNPHAWKCSGHKCHSWIQFEHIDGLVIYGSGTIDGQGKNWWKHKNSCNDDKIFCDKKPTGFVISHSNNVHLHQLTFLDSPQMHIAVERSTWIHVMNLNISAPGDSPNTDGIHIQHSSNVSIHNSTIGTGDDCVSIGDGSSYVNIKNVFCGPGHGISIGSLGIHGKRETVEFVHVRNVTLSGTTNGVRIKSWQGGSGYARNIIFEHITTYGSKHPLIIDQYYCPHKHCKDQTSAVHISDVTYSHIYGTSATDTAVELRCSKTSPCTNIIMKDVHLQFIKQEEETTSSCVNARGLTNDKVFPIVPCLHVDQNL